MDHEDKEARAKLQNCPVVGPSHENMRQHALSVVNDLFDQFPDGDIEFEETIDYEPEEVDLQAVVKGKDMKHIPIRYNIKIYMNI